MQFSFLASNSTALATAMKLHQNFVSKEFIPKLVQMLKSLQSTKAQSTKSTSLVTNVLQVLASSFESMYFYCCKIQLFQIVQHQSMQKQCTTLFPHSC